MKLRRLFILLFASILFIGFASCSSDDEDPVDPISKEDKSLIRNIIATWHYQKVEPQVEVNETRVKAIITRKLSVAPSYNTVFTFFNNSRYDQKYGVDAGMVNVGSYAIKDAVLSLRNDGTTTPVKYDLSISGDVLKMGVDHIGDYDSFDEIQSLLDEIGIIDITAETVVVTKAYVSDVYAK